MQNENKNLDFNNQAFFIGIDVHQKSWNVTIISSERTIKTISMNPSPKELYKYMANNFPGGKYYSVYEAGFSGFWAHRELESLGFNNIVVSPTDIPTSGKEKLTKSDIVDSRKLARELSNGSLKGIYIPEQLIQELRSLVRARAQVVKNLVRIKLQIKSYLNFYGNKFPANYEITNWSGKFIKHLRSLSFNYDIGKEQLDIYLDLFEEQRSILLKIVKSIKKYCTDYGFYDRILLLCSVPGIGFINAVVLITEIVDMKRFTNFDSLASYVGLVPSKRSSSEKEYTLGLKVQCKRKLREILVEASWVAIRQDPALVASYGRYVRRMSKQEAIIRVAKKLLSRIRYVWYTQQKYEFSLK